MNFLRNISYLLAVFVTMCLILIALVIKFWKRIILLSLLGAQLPMIVMITYATLVGADSVTWQLNSFGEKFLELATLITLWLTGLYIILEKKI